jgi:hypothetical protein
VAGEAVRPTPAGCSLVSHTLSAFSLLHFPSISLDIPTSHHCIPSVFRSRSHPRVCRDRATNITFIPINRSASFIAAAKTTRDAQTVVPETDEPSLDDAHYTDPVGPLFSYTPYLATRLSPFYLATPPDLEACKSDAENEVMICALERLSEAGVDARSPSTSPDPQPRAAPRRTTAKIRAQPGSSGKQRVIGGRDRQNRTLDEEETTELLEDTETYIASLLFKPATIPREAETADDLDHPMSNLTVDPAVLSFLSRRTSASQSGSKAGSARVSPGEVSRRPSLLRNASSYSSASVDTPYSRLKAELFPAPISSRAAATASYLYLHFILSRLWPTDLRSRVDPSLLYLLVETLRADAGETERAMRIGASSCEMFIWKVVIGAYVVRVMGRRDGVGDEALVGWDQERDVEMGGSDGSTDSDNDDDDDDGSSGEEADGDTEMARDTPRTPTPRLSKLARRRQRRNAWLREAAAGFGENMRSWSRAVKVTEWAQARQALDRITWVEDWEDKWVVERIWEEALLAVE